MFFFATIVENIIKGDCKMLTGDLRPDSLLNTPIYPKSKLDSRALTYASLVYHPPLQGDPQSIGFMSYNGDAQQVYRTHRIICTDLEKNTVQVYLETSPVQIGLKEEVYRTNPNFMPLTLYLTKDVKGGRGFNGSSEVEKVFAQFVQQESERLAISSSSRR